MGTITRNFANNILGTGEVDATDGVNGTIPATNVADASLNNVTSLPSSVGYAIKSVASDPPSLNEGEIFYNSTAGAFKALVNVEAWSSGASMSFNRAYIAGFGTTTAAVGAGGYNSPPATFETATEEYNGSGWSTGGALNTARWGIRGAGSQTAGLAFFGIVPGSPSRSAATEEYDGSSWTNGGNLSEARYQGAAAGTQTTGLAFGGGPAVASPPVSTATEEYNGTAWTTGGALNTAIRDNASASAAPQTAALSFGGNNTSGYSSQSEEYDGTSWTVVNSMSLARAVLGGSGIQTSALGYGGAGTPGNSINKTETYDGTNWSTSPADLATGRRYLAGAGSNSSAAVAFQGKQGITNTVLTEEFNSSTNTITAAAWASGANMPEANYGAGSFGTQNAFVYFGGQPYPPRTNATREYNGTAWATTGNYTGSLNYLAGCGVESAGLGAGGFSGPTTTASAEYDGSTWTAVNSMSQQRQNTGSTMIGTQPAALIVGGDQYPSTPRSLSVCEEYDGTNWTSGGAYPVVIQNTAAAGTQTAGWAAGGISDITPGTGNIVRDSTNHYNGTAWTAGGSLPTTTYRAGAAGTQTAGLLFSGTGDGTSNLSTTFGYDGSSWSTRPNMATARQSIGAGGVSSPSTAAIGAGGYITPGTTAVTEEFTGETITQVAKTLSSS